MDGLVEIVIDGVADALLMNAKVGSRTLHLCGTLLTLLIFNSNPSLLYLFNCRATLCCHLLWNVT